MKRLTEQEAAKFRCPRWEELPGIPLYMDQVVILLEETIGIFVDEKERVVTNSMINNYVKQKIVSAPVKKKYGKKHLAALIVVSILKKVLSMMEISAVIDLMIKEHGMECAYNLFCAHLEQSLKNAFVLQDAPVIEAVPRGTRAETVLRASLAALTGKLLVQDCIVAV